jgi:serine/threonine-protein kinase
MFRDTKVRRFLTPDEEAPRAIGLDPELWLEASRILDEALELSPAERPSFVGAAGAHDAQLRAYVERLLTADAATGGVLELAPAAAFASLHDDRVASFPTGQVLGSWRLIREIGHGGMGAVVLAERADGAYEQQVAIKRIRRDLVTDDLLRRFTRERRILARLEHPNIARAVDAGTAGDGTPWLAMEFVVGEPINEWCACRETDLDATIALFGQVADAVQFAHQRFVIHRDLKPSNILISESGAVKLLDFGIAKLLEGDDVDPSVTTDLDRRLTPHYASPEQVRGEPASAATDVYALGVVLYELVTGVKPHGSQHDSVIETVRRVLEHDPVGPSTALRRGEVPARNRAWQPKVRGDLDNIVMKALRREPAERYQSVQALTDDLARWRQRERVLATPPTLVYRARRFVARNRIPVLAASVVMLSLLGGIAATSWQARVAALERDRAQLEARKANEISAFVMSLFDAADPNVAKGDSVTARMLVDRGAERVERELAGQPEVQASMFERLSLIYQHFDLFPEALDMSEKRVEAATAAFGTPSNEVAAALSQRGGVLTNRGDFAAAESVLTRSLAMSRSLEAPHQIDVAQTLSWLGTVYRMLQRYGEAERYFRESIAIKERELGADHRDLSPQVNALGQVLRDTDRPAEALPVLERGLAIRMRTLGPQHLETAQSMEDLARALQNMGRLAEAESLHVRTLAIRRQLVGSRHVSLARTLSPLAWIHITRGERARGDSLLTEAVQLFRAVLGDAHPETILNQNGLAWLRIQLGDFVAADTLLRSAQPNASRVYGPDHSEALRALYNQALLERARGNPAKAEQLLRHIAAREAATGAPARARAATLNELASLLRANGRQSEADEIVRRRGT